MRCSLCGEQIWDYDRCEAGCLYDGLFVEERPEGSVLPDSAGEMSDAGS